MSKRFCNVVSWLCQNQEPVSTRVVMMHDYVRTTQSGATLLMVT